MNDRERARFEMFKRASAFGTTNADDFQPAPPATTTKAQQLFDSLQDVVEALTEMTTTQMGQTSEYHAGTTNKSVLRDGLMLELRRWNRTATAIATSENKPEVMDKFRMPYGTNDVALAAAARAFVDAGEDFKAKFIELGHEANFTTALLQRISNFEAAEANQSSALQARSGATASLSELIQNGIAVVKQLDAIMHNKYASDAEKLGAWTTASHVERTSEKKPTAAAAAKAAQPVAVK